MKNHPPIAFIWRGLQAIAGAGRVGLCFLLLVAVAAVAAQAQTSFGKIYHGTINTDVPNAQVETRAGAGITAGSTMPPSGDKLGLILWENPANMGLIDQAKTYSLGTGDFEIVAMDTAATVGTLAVVANRTEGRAADAVFFHVAANGSVLGTRYWATSSGERLRDVEALSDGTFIVAGSVTTVVDGTQRAFVARIGSQSQAYAVQWVRILGISVNAPQAEDEAISIEQFPDGRLLVCAFSDQAASTSQGAVLLWTLSQAGVTTSLQRYEMDASLIRPFPSDMKLLSDGTVHICGSALQSASSAAHKGWYMQLDANLDNAACKSVTLTGYPDRNLELRAIDGKTGTTALWTVGTVARPTSPTVDDDQALAIAINGAGTPLMSFLDGPTGDDAFNDVLVSKSGTKMRLLGPSNRAFHIVTDMLRTNFYVSKMLFSSLSCSNNIEVSIQTRQQSVTKTAVTMTTTSIMTTTLVALAVNNFTVDTQNTCQIAKMANPDLQVEDDISTADPTSADEPTGDE